MTSNSIRVAAALVVTGYWSLSPAWAVPDIAAVTLPPLATTTTQGLPQTSLGLFTFSVSAALNLVNNDPGAEAVYNLQAGAASQYTTQYYACAPRGGGCSTTPTTILATDTATAVSAQPFADGEQATAIFTFTYTGALSFQVTSTNAPAADNFTLTLVDSAGQVVASATALDATYSLYFYDPAFARDASYSIISMPIAPNSGGIANTGGTGTDVPAGATPPDPSAPSSVPEPFSAAILASAVIGAMKLRFETGRAFGRNRR